MVEPEDTGFTSTPKHVTNKSGKKANPNNKKKPRKPKAKVYAVPFKRSGGRKDCIHELARSVLDPFRYSACIPDGSTGSGKFSTKATFQIATGAGGSCGMFALNPGELNNEYFILSGATTSEPAVSGNWVASTQTTAITTLYQRVRPVSAGFRLSYTGSTMSDQGVLVLMQVPAGFLLSTFNLGTLYNNSAAAQWYKIIPLRQGGTIIWRPGDVDDQGVFTAVQANAAVSSSTVVPRPYLVGFIYGAAASSSVATIEYVVNYEGQYRSQGFAPGGINTLSAPAPEVGWYERAHAMYNKVAPIVSLIAENGFNMMAAARSPASNLVTARSGITVEELD